VSNATFGHRRCLTQNAPLAIVRRPETSDGSPARADAPPSLLPCVSPTYGQGSRVTRVRKTGGNVKRIALTGAVMLVALCFAHVALGSYICIYREGQCDVQHYCDTAFRWTDESAWTSTSNDYLAQRWDGSSTTYSHEVLGTVNVWNAWDFVTSNNWRATRYHTTWSVWEYKEASYNVNPC
jgi:hypothetical protein